MSNDPLARFRSAPERRKPQVFAVGRKADIKAWEADARLTEDVTPITCFADTADLRARGFQADDVVVYLAGYQRLVDSIQVVNALAFIAEMSTEPQVVNA